MRKVTFIRSFHHQARRPISRKALLAGFLSVWLKRCVVPSPSSDAILPTVLLLAIRLVHGRSLGLLPAMVCCIQRGFHALTEAFCRPPTMKSGKGTILPRDGPNPRIGLPYTYLMAWFALHCPAIIQAGEEPPEGVRIVDLRDLHGYGLMWPRSASCCVGTTSIVSSGASLISAMRAMAKNSRMWEMGRRR